MCIYIGITGRKYNKAASVSECKGGESFLFSCTYFYFCVFLKYLFTFKKYFWKTSTGIIKNLSFCGWLTKHFYV